MELFKALFSTLNRGKIRYMVAGGIAVNLYGIERATADLDIVLNLDEENLRRFIGATRSLGLKPKMPVKLDDFVNAQKRKEWINEKGMMVFSLYDPQNLFFLLDIFVEIPFDFDEVYRNEQS